MRIDKLITIGVLAVTALVTYVCVKRTEETVKERQRELNMIDPHEETSITLENEELSTDERAKAKTILDDKKNDIFIRLAPRRLLKRLFVNTGTAGVTSITRNL